MLGLGIISRQGGQNELIDSSEGHLILCGVDGLYNFCTCMHGIGLDGPDIGVNGGAYAVAAGNIPALQD